jgi:hypothetical protein
MGWDDLGIDWLNPEQGIHVYSALQEVAKAINERHAINDAHYQEFPLLALSEDEFTQVQFQLPFFRAINTPTTTSVSSLLNPFKMITFGIDQLFGDYARTDITEFDPEVDDTNLNRLGMPDPWGSRSNYESITSDTTLTDIEAGDYFTGAGVDSAMLTDLYNLLSEIKFVFLDTTKLTSNVISVGPVDPAAFPALWTAAPTITTVTTVGGQLNAWLGALRIPSVFAPPNGDLSGTSVYGEEEYTFFNQAKTAMPTIVTPANTQCTKRLILPFTGLQFASPQCFTEDSYVTHPVVSTASSLVITKQASEFSERPDPLQFLGGGQRTNLSSQFLNAKPCFDIDDTAFLDFATL